MGGAQAGPTRLRTDGAAPSLNQVATCEEAGIPQNG